MANPLPDIYDALWAMLEDSSDFCSYVPSTNRIKYVDDTDTKWEPEKRDVPGAGRLPEVRVQLVGARPDAFGDSSNSGIILRFSIDVTTGERNQYSLLNVIWAIWEAMHDWDTRLQAVTWNTDEIPVRWCRALAWEDSMDNEALNRGSRGWTSVWQCEIGCWFSRSGLTGSGS